MDFKIKINLKNSSDKFFNIIKKSLIRFIKNQGPIVANGLAIKTITAIAPFLLILATILRLFFPSFNDVKENFLNILKKFIMPNSFEVIVFWINTLLSKSGAISIISLFIFIYLFIDLLFSLDIHIEKIWATNLKPSVSRKILKYWALLTISPFILAGYFYYSVFIRSFLELTPLANISKVDDMFHAFIFFILLTCFFTISYIIIPNAKVNIKKAFVVSVFVSLSFILLKFIYSYYTEIFITKWSFLYGSFVMIIIFIFWTAINWNIILYSIEFLCVWQNKLYLRRINYQSLYLFDIAFILLILQEFYNDFIHFGKGVSIHSLSVKFKYNINDMNNIFSILKKAGIIICDNKLKQKFYLKKSLSKVTLDEIENIVFDKLKSIDADNNSSIYKIYENLKKYYCKISNKNTGIDLFFE